MIKKIRSSLSAKVFLYIATLLLVCSLIIYGVVMVVMPKSYKSELAGQFTVNLNQLITQLENVSENEAPDIIYDFCLANQANVTLESKKGKTNYSFIDENKSLENKNQTYETETAVATLHFNNSNELYTLNATASARSINQITALFIKLLPWILLLILAIASVGALFCTRFLTKPIIKISNISKRMSALDMTWHCDIDRTDEIGVLAASLNSMAQNLDTALTNLKTANDKLQADIDWERKQEKQRRDFFAAVSHELKTPITIIKGQLEGMVYNVGIYKDREQYLRHSLKTVKTMESLVKELLSVSKMETQGFRLELEEINISDMVSSCCRQIEGLAEDKEIAFHLSIETGITFYADKKLLAKALSNVMSNAVFHSPVGASVKVSLFRINDKGILTVENSGAHIGQEDIGQLFTPFFRVDKSHNRNTGGSGLGLYIVKTIFDLHRLTYHIENTDSGVKFTTEFS